MKKLFAFILALIMCLSLCACGKSADLEKALCSGIWVSSNDICKLSDNIEERNISLRFFEDGTCEKTWQFYLDGVPSNDPGSIVEYWKIKNGKVAIYPEIVDSDNDVVYFEFTKEKLVGSTVYCDEIIYTNTPLSNTEKNETQEEATENTPKYDCYEGTKFPDFRDAVDGVYCTPETEEDEWGKIYSYIGSNEAIWDKSKSYESDILKSFEKKTFVHKQSENLSFNYTAWLDGEGNALRIIRSCSSTTYTVEIRIIPESRLDSYIATLD